MLLFSLLCWVVFTLAIAFVKPPAHRCLVHNGTHTVMEIPYATRRRRDVTSLHVMDEDHVVLGMNGHLPRDDVLLTMPEGDHLFIVPPKGGNLQVNENYRQFFCDSRSD